ncbi:hypothetical protein L195_g037209, partial [Trifolium pratense]
MTRCENLTTDRSKKEPAWVLSSFGLQELVLDRGEKIELLVDKTENLQFQLPEAGQAAEKEDVAAKSPNEADGGRRDPYFSYNIMGYCLWGFQMLIE